MWVVRARVSSSFRANRAVVGRGMSDEPVGHRLNPRQCENDGVLSPVCRLCGDRVLRAGARPTIRAGRAQSAAITGLGARPVVMVASSQS
jgi:hypothetical protein